MKRTVRGVTLSVAAAVVISSWAAAPALAASRHTKASAKSGDLASWQAVGAHFISLRLTALGKTIPAVQSNKFLTAADKSTLLGFLDADVTGLTALGKRIQADTTVAAARHDISDIFYGYRVFALRIPQTRLAAAADDFTDTVLPKLTDARSRLASLVRGPDASRDNASVNAAIANLSRAIQAISSDTSGLSAMVLRLTPPDYNANHTILAGPRKALLSARAEVKEARKDIKAALGELK